MSHLQELIGRRMRSRRVLMGLTLAQVARRSGLSFQQIQKYETGRCAISSARLWALSQALNIEVSYFYGELAAEVEMRAPNRRFESMGATLTQHP